MSEEYEKEIAAWVFIIPVTAGIDDEFEWSIDEEISIGGDLEDRDDLEMAWESLGDNLKEQVRKTDSLAVEYAAAVFEKVKSSFDIEKRRVNIPLSRWWWWLDKVAAGEIVPELDGD